MTETSFRFANSKDVTAIAALIERAYRGTEALNSWTSEAGLLNKPRSNSDEIASFIAQEDKRFVIAIRDGELVGCALIERHGENGYFGMLSISPSTQTAGLGTALLAQVEANVRDLWQCTAMTLLVISLRDELIAWYQRRGYALTGRHKPFPFDLHPASGRVDFDFVEMKKSF